MTKTTDWESFYRRRGTFSLITAYMAFHSFFSALHPHLRQIHGNVPLLVELGGGNSIFYDYIRKTFPESALFLIDRCQTTQAFARKIADDKLLHDIKADLLADEESLPLSELQCIADIVFSFGLIEHFTPENTAVMIARHFMMAKPGGLVYISFPTPVLPYRVVRFCLEGLNLWPFHDERPLLFDEVRRVGNNYGRELASGICLRLGLVQGYILYRAE